jgi:sugar-specific transcriptional regulator TrmB
MIEQALKQIGLTEGEIKVYLALLELGSCSTGKITKESGISGSKVYEVLERLEKKGLVSSVKINNVKYFEPTDPKRIVDYLDEKKKNIESEKEEIEKIIPQLILKQSNSINSEVNVFTGFKGAKNVFEKVIEECKKGDELLGFGLTEQPKSWEIHFNKREKVRDGKGIIHKSIINEKYKSLHKARKDFPNTYFRFFPKKMEMPTTALIWKNKVALYVITKENPITIVIENQATADSFKRYFELMWKTAKIK